MEKSTKIWLTVIFLLTIGLRLTVAFQTHNLNYEAYPVLRQVENIVEKGVPLFYDDLSYGGRIHLFSPIYHYFLALFGLVFPTILVLKIVPNLLAALLIFVVYRLAEYLTKNENVSLLAALLSGFIPVFFNTTINDASIMSVVIPLFFLTIYYFLQTNRDSKYLNKLIICMVLLTIIHPLSILLAVSLIIYLLLIKVQNFRESMREPEIVLFYTFLAFWINIMIYKQALLMHGKFILWQNIPTQLIQNTYSQLTFLDAIYAIGVIPLIFGLTSLYISLFSSKRKTITLMLSICLAVFILLLIKALELNIGLIFLGVALSILSSYSIKRFYEVAKQARFSGAPTLFLILFLVIFLITFIPNINTSIERTTNGPDQKQIEAFLWLKNNTQNSSIIMTSLKEGSAMSYYSERKNVIDTNFLLIRNIDSRYLDSIKIYDDRFLTTALERLDYYSVNYILLSEETANERNITKLAFEGDCVSQVYPQDDSLPKIYRINCRLNQ